MEIGEYAIDLFADIALGRRARKLDPDLMSERSIRTIKDKKCVTELTFYSNCWVYALRMTLFG